VHGEHDPLELRPRVHVAADLLDLDPSRFVEREASDAGAERDQREAARAELVGARERGGGGAADHVRGRRAAQLHRRGVDDPAGRHVAARGLDRLAEADRRALARLGVDRGTAGAGDRRRDAAAVQQPGVRGVRDRIHLERGDVCFEHLDRGHRSTVPSMTVRKRVRAHGRVQGVFFRDSVRRAAGAAGVAGWAANRGDGTVEAVFEGPAEAVQHLVELCRSGPGHAEVTRLDIADEPPEGLSGFDVV
jgi:acylphosphatase